MRTSLAVMLVGLAACGGPAEGPKAPTSGEGTAAKPSSPGDVSFEIPPIEVKGVLFEPEALYRPDMMLFDPKNKKMTLEKQRAAFASAKDPVQKQAQAAVLATMLYYKWKDEKDDAQKKSLLTEARQALRDVAQAAGDKADEITLALLGRYELLLEDYDAAAKAFGALVTKVPKEAAHNKVWWVFSLLRAHDNAGAIAALKDEPVTEAQPELAYLTGWAKWRTGDAAGAWQAMVTAAKGWKDKAGREALDRDMMLFAGRTNATFNDGFAALSPIYGKGKDQQYELVAKLGLQAYQFAGRWADGVAALGKAVDIGGDHVPPNDLPVLRYQQADYTVRLDDPVAAAKFAKEAIEALPKCGPKCSDKDKENIVESVYVMGRLFHILYATANDVRYYEPAHDLYNLAIPLITMNDATREQAKKDADILERTFKAMKHDAGTHDKQALGALLNRHNQEIQACYEQGLSANPKLAGNLVINVEADQTGTIKGVATEPAAGLGDMSAVASCVSDRVKSWRLPKRANGTGPAGTTRMKLTYAMSKRTDVH